MILFGAGQHGITGPKTAHKPIEFKLNILI